MIMALVLVTLGLVATMILIAARTPTIKPADLIVEKERSHL